MRAKFICESVTNRNSYGNKYQTVQLNAVYATVKKGDSEEPDTENNQFSVATPSGKVEMTISNPKAIDFFEPGKSYYLDFTEAPK